MSAEAAQTPMCRLLRSWLNDRVLLRPNDEDADERADDAEARERDRRHRASFMRAP